METAKQALERIKKEMGHEGKQTRNSAGYMKFRITGREYGIHHREREIIAKSIEEAREIFKSLDINVTIDAMTQMYIEENELGIGCMVKKGKKVGMIRQYGKEQCMVRWESHNYKHDGKYIHPRGTYNDTKNLKLI